LGMEMPVSGVEAAVWARADAVKAQRSRGRMRGVRLFIFVGDSGSTAVEFC
jgi:hypothetical protein